MNDEGSDHQHAGSVGDLSQRLAGLDGAVLRTQLSTGGSTGTVPGTEPTNPGADDHYRDRACRIVERLFAAARGEALPELHEDMPQAHEKEPAKLAPRPGTFVVFADGSERLVGPGPAIDIGRGEDVRGLRLDVWGLSRMHLRLEFGDGVVAATDLGSTNGTACVRESVEIDLTRDQSFELQAGDVLTVAGAMILFVEERG